MGLIYEPKGKAREYSPLALNVYTGGCDHACSYCYCRDMPPKESWGPEATPRDLTGLEKDSVKADRQVLLSFMSDPYCRKDTLCHNTENALMTLRDAGCSVAILTKGGMRCLRDRRIFREWPDRRIKVGATLTFFSPQYSRKWEPGAALPAERLLALRELHEAGVPTWASIEPVIDPTETLAIIGESIEFVDSYMLGKWNHDRRADYINWPEYAMAAVKLIRSCNRPLYVKKDLRPYVPAGFLKESEIDPDALTVADRPKGWGNLL